MTILSPIFNSPQNLRQLAKRKREQSQLQLRYLSSAIALEETINPYLVRNAMMAVSAAVMAFIIWAAIANISEISRAYGEIVPQSFTRVVQHLDGGIVREINVTERQLVKKGDVLIVLDGTGVTQDLGEVKAREISLALQKERLGAFIEHRRPDFARIDASESARQQQLRAYDAMLAARENERNVLADQLAQKEKAMKVVGARMGALSKNMSLAKTEQASLSDLKAKNLVTASRYTDSQRRLNDTQGEIAAASSERSEAADAVNEYRQRLSMLDAKYKNEAYDDLHTTEADYDQNTQRLEKMQQRFDRLQVVAPVTGLVKGLKVNTIGGVIKPGETILEVVPVDDTLVAEVHIRPQDMGQVAEGQKVRVKVSSYDFARFGALEGKLSMVSATTFADETGTKYYHGRVTLENPYVGANPDLHRLMPGMTVEADIITGEKSVLGYLLKPVQVALSNALTEK